MELSFSFFIESIGLGAALAMDAFSVSLANGLNEPCMKKKKMLGIAGLFAFFQAIMPLIGWICIRTIAQYFQSFEKMVPYIALALLGFIGVKMIIDGVRDSGCECEERPAVGFWALIVQGIATSIDALSAGFAFEKYDDALVVILAAALIAAITFIICYIGIYVGRKAGTKLAGKAGIFGGIILILIGLEIFITGII